MKLIFAVFFVIAGHSIVAQDWKLSLHFPLQEMPYLKFKNSIPVNQLQMSNWQYSDWKGRAVGAIDGFQIHRLPLDGMLCLIPSNLNPAMTGNMVVPAKAPGVTTIPNAIKYTK